MKWTVRVPVGEEVVEGGADGEVGGGCAGTGDHGRAGTCGSEAHAARTSSKMRVDTTARRIRMFQL